MLGAAREPPQKAANDAADEVDMSSPSPRIAAELFTIPVDDAFVVYAPLRQVAFVANAALVNQIVDLQQGCADLAEDQVQELVKFLRRLQIVDGGPEFSPDPGCSGAPKPTMVTLFLTTCCNLRCTYCYASAGDGPRKTMPWEIAQRGIDFILANALELGREEIEIGFHGGGEPSLNWETLTRSCAYAERQARQHGLRVRAAMATNGVLPEGKIDWIIDHLDSSSVSFDGLPSVHDSHRLNLAGSGSSAAVEHTIRRFDDAGFDYALRMTVTHDHIDQLADSVHYVCRNFRPRRMQIEPAYLLGRWKHAPSAETQAFIDGFREAAAVADEYGQVIQFSAARLGTLSNHFCRATQDGFGLTADGSVSACYEVFVEDVPYARRFIYGRYDHSRQTFQFALSVLDHLRKRTVDRSAFCEGCFCKWSCGGDCYYKSLAVHGDGPFQGTDRCHIIRELTKDQLLAKIESSGGFCWQGLPDQDLRPAAALETS